MIMGIGIDIAEVSRFKKWTCNQGLLEKYFNKNELEQINNKGNFTCFSLAARFAGKEAFGKALGLGLKGIRLKDIAILNDFNGKPEIKLTGSALNAFNKIGADKLHISLTHEKEFAAALVIIEKSTDSP